LRANRFTGVSTADIQWLGTKEAARRLGVTTRTLYRFIDDGQLTAYRMGRVIRLKETELADFIERCRIEPGSLDVAGGPDDESEDQDATDTSATAPTDA
jgi:excisionase family DNA binding protein